MSTVTQVATSPMAVQLFSLRRAVDTPRSGDEPRVIVLPREPRAARVGVAPVGSVGATLDCYL
ncbi:hypothetical protein [Motilibacter aurantiacus]|uniref:hypothetical protein n=1 Tax=Motilibacter aurantiacus TaxID=2714955 RepID=UPI00140C92CE|nr:hypothetical protein [Motilibacter aurantiacus]NHC46419.1 hypothetical protein [Motilibacter aurantiacus]